VPELSEAPASHTPAGTTGIETLLPAIFDTVADGVTVLDRSGMVRFANEAAARLIGVESAAGLVGRPSSALTDAFELLNEDGTTFDLAKLPTRQALLGEADAEAVVRFRRHGSRDDRWSLVRARLLPGATPESDLVVTSFQDITHLKRVERRLSFLSDASAALTDAVEQPEALGRIAWMAVPFVADWCAIDVVEDSKEMHRLALAHGEAGPPMIDQEAQPRWPLRSLRRGGIDQVLQSGHPVHLKEVTEEFLRSTAMNDEWLAGLKPSAVREALIVPLAGRGRVLGALTAVNLANRPPMSREDVEMVKELGRRAGATVDAARLMFEAQDAVRVRDEFMAIASHDMRTPLAAIRGYAQLARRHLTKEPRDLAALDRWLADIDESAERLTGLVSEFMDISLLHGGQAVPLQLQRVDLVELVGERVREHSGANEQTHEFTVSSGAPEIIGIWDGPRLARVLDNVLGNAVKFSPAGSAIEVRIWTEDGLGCVAVVDQGIGISLRDQSLIFGPMYRAENARGVSGTGLGLAGSRSILQLMGGEITVASRLGEGSTFTIRLPLEPSAAAGEGAEEPSA
jgi:PAS domain S-box-containing protein